MPNHDEAVAVLAAAFNDVDRSLIGDPYRRGSNGVGIETQDIDEALALARHLATLQVQVRSTLEHDSEGNVAAARVVVHDASDQKRLFEALEHQLDPEHRQRFKDLVLARGPIPDDILENIWRSYRGGRNPHQIANSMNDQAVISGMGELGWTVTKVRNALTEYERRASNQEAA
jgi:hypothetical protein